MKKGRLNDLFYVRPGYSVRLDHTFEGNTKLLSYVGKVGVIVVPPAEKTNMFIYVQFEDGNIFPCIKTELELVDTKLSSVIFSEPPIVEEIVSALNIEFGTNDIFYDKKTFSFWKRDEFEKKSDATYPFIRLTTNGRVWLSSHMIDYSPRMLEAISKFYIDVQQKGWQ